MRVHWAIAGCGVLLACAGAPRVAPETAVRPEADSPFVAPTPVPVEPAPSVAPPQASDASARFVAEVSAMPPAAQWAWALAVMPELAEHTDVAPALAGWAEFRRRTAGRTVLWVRERDGRCFAVKGAWDDEGFHGRAREVTRIKGDVKAVRFETITVSERGITASGPHGEEFTRDARGRWQAAGGFGLGSFETIADGPVSAVERGAVYFSGHDYTLTIACSGTQSRTERCADGSTRRCERCSSLWARPQGRDRGWAAGGSVSIGEAGPGDCSVPCPPDELTPRIAALDVAVAGRRFVDAEEPVAAVYDDPAACRGDPRMRRRRSREGEE